jgi:hypothetical protein
MITLTQLGELVWYALIITSCIIILAKSLGFRTKEKQPKFTVLGKVPNMKFFSQHKWVIGEADKPIALGSGTVYHWLDGGRCGTLHESEFAKLVTQAEMREAAGKQYRIYTWKELMGEQDDK